VGRGWWWRVLRASADDRRAHVYGERAYAFDTVFGRAPRALSFAEERIQKPRAISLFRCAAAS
jgi:hypothetical protein